MREEEDDIQEIKFHEVTIAIKSTRNRNRRSIFYMDASFIWIAAYPERNVKSLQRHLFRSR